MSIKAFRMMKTNKEELDIISIFGTDTFNQSMARYGAHRSQVLFAQLRYQVKRGMDNLLMTITSNLNISQTWKTRRGKQCHAILEQLHTKVLLLRQMVDHLEERHFPTIKVCLQESSNDGEWRKLRLNLASLKWLAEEMWSSFMNRGMVIVNDEIKPLTLAWKDLNPNMPDILLSIKVGLIGTLVTFEMTLKAFQLVVNYWMSYIDHHWPYNPWLIDEF